MSSNNSIQNEINKHVFDKLNNTHFKWNWNGLSQNPIMTWDMVLEYPDKPWSWWALSKNPNITWDIVINNPSKPWNWEGLSSNPIITMDVVLANRC
jgi:hypothetical protein